MAGPGGEGARKEPERDGGDSGCFEGKARPGTRYSTGSTECREKGGRKKDGASGVRKGKDRCSVVRRGEGGGEKVGDFALELDRY